MASNLALTLTQNLRASYKGLLDKWEQRQSNYGGLRLFQKQTNDPMSILDPELQQLLERSFGNTVQVPVTDFENVTISNVRTCAIQTGGLTSKLLNVTFATYAFGFVMVPAQHENNDVKYEATFNKLLMNRIQKLAATLDSAAIAKLETAKNQHYPAAITAFYPETGDALQIAQADKLDFYNQLGSILDTMDFGQIDLDVLTNPNGMPLVRRLLAQGEGNQVNESFQFENLGYNWMTSNRVTNGTGVQSTLYAVAPGAVAMASRIDPDARMGSRVGEHKVWSRVNVPIINMDMGVYYNADCTDASAIQASGTAGLTRTKIESFEYSVDVAFLSAYNSAQATTYSPIIKAEILTT